MSALDKKEAVLVQLRSMNDEAGGGLHAGPSPATWRAPFKRAYAVLLLQVPPPPPPPSFPRRRRCHGPAAAWSAGRAQWWAEDRWWWRRRGRDLLPESGRQVVAP